MTANGWLQIILFFLVILAITRPLGHLPVQGLRGPGPAAAARSWARSSASCCACAASTGDETQSWKQYAAYLLVFSGFGVLVTYAIQRLQHVLPWNPQNLGPDAAPTWPSTPPPASPPTPTGSRTPASRR